jgi:hypothetical protein
LQFQDTTLTPGTTYYYTITALNSAGESASSTVLQLTTKDLVTPEGVKNPRIASGDSKVILTWDFQYDAKYDILRSETKEGTYETIATDINGVRYEDAGRTNDKTYYYKVVAQNAAGHSPETAVLTATPEYGQQVRLSFNENTGTFAEDVWGGYHSTLAATAGWNEGYHAGALKLDGTATSYASLAGSPVSSLNDFTIAAWVKMDALSTWMRIFDFGTGTSKYMFLTPQAGVTNGKSTIRYGIKNGSTEQQVNFAYTFPLNTWTHLAITQSGNTVSLYVNGELAASNTGITLKPSGLGATSQNYIGKSQWADPLLKGSVDEFRIYNYGLSDEEVKGLANGKEIKRVQTISFQPFADMKVGDEDKAPVASASSSLPVSFSSSDENVATIVDGKVHIAGGGTAVITAMQEGNEIYKADPSVTQSLNVFIPPVVKTQNLQVEADGNGNASVTPGQIDNGSVSYNGALTLSLDKTNFNCSNIGIPVTVTLTGTDAKGYTNAATATVSVVDLLKPVLTAPAGQFFCYSVSNSYQVPALTATDNCGVASVSYEVSGATTRTGSGADASGTFNEGQSILTWTVTDVHGNVSTISTTVTINPAFSASVSNAFALSSGTEANTVYTGYQPATSLTLSATANGGTAPYTYSWSSGQNTRDITVNAAGTYKVTVIDAKGCPAAPLSAMTGSAAVLTTTAQPGNASGSTTITIKTKNVVCGNNNDKVQICHINSRVACIENCVSQDAVATHLAHGDMLGSCTTTTIAAANSLIEEASAYSVTVYPNPVWENLNLKVSTLHAGAMVKVYSGSGAVVLSQRLTNTTQSFSVKTLTPGIYYVQVINGEKTRTEKIVKQ